MQSHDRADDMAHSKNRSVLRFLAGFFLVIGSAAASGQKAVPDSLPWSVRMAESVIKRNPSPGALDFRPRPRWGYVQGLVLLSLQQVWAATGNPRYLDYGKQYCDLLIDSSGAIRGIQIDEYNIDNINAGKILFKLLDQTQDPKYKKALLLLRSQFEKHPRTSEGGFWHKKIYPHQMWLDGLYMGSPFLAEFASRFGEPVLFDDVANQFILMEKHGRDAKTGLLHHGWDESRQQKWADPVTGKSPHFWGRGMGWFAMALVDALDFIPKNHPRRNDLIGILKRTVRAITDFQDGETGLWYQVLDQGRREGNYLESSASTMFVYALAKAARNKWIPDEYLGIAEKGYQGILRHLITVDDDGTVHINEACAGAGLGGNPYRDGSYEYYIHEMIRTDDGKAVGPFIMASLLFESLHPSGNTGDSSPIK
jgi:unsaturated rhamnogalacturonyl hydrolase